ncbi:MAG: hypothetical protein L6Q71_10790 [Planctomycetes bacterium]|nr:hypothetical protein [Planctomycetota bacterium]
MISMIQASMMALGLLFSTGELGPSERDAELPHQPLSAQEIPATDPSLERKYSDKFEQRVREESAKAGESIDTLYYGMVAVLVGVFGIAVHALIAARRQDQALARLASPQGAK